MDLIPKARFQVPSYILNDLCTRFIINIPGVESRDIVRRVFFQIELAHWFYLDFYLPENPDLRSVTLKEFSAQIFVFCPTLSAHCKKFDAMFESWKEYKQSIPTYGAILLDPTLQYCLLVRGFSVKATWGFPKGKVNPDERPVDCAIREVLEETGFDTRDLIDENLFLENRFNDRISRLYIVPNVPLDTHFQPQTRQEIKDFNWFRVDCLPVHKKDNISKQHYGLGPNAFFMVMPFIKKLKAIISQPLAKQLSLPNLGKGQQRFGPQPAAATKTPMETKPLTEKKRQKKQQFSPQMSQQLQDFIFHQETQPSMFPYVAVPPASKSILPRQRKRFSQTNKPRSPVKKSATEQLQILHFGPQPAAATKAPMETKPLTEKKRQKRQQFSPQMNQQLQDFIFHQEMQPSTFPYVAVPPASKSILPRQRKRTNKPRSPVKKSATKQLQILKRDGTLTQRATGEIPKQGP